jgi:uncharacterized protein YjdB
MRIIFPILILSVFTGCINEVEVDEPLPERILIESKTVTMMIGDKLILTTSYWNEFGILTERELNWSSSSPDVASVAQGEVMALSTGQTKITGSILGIDGELIQSNELLLRVIESLSDLASVSINSSQNNPDVNATIQLTYIAKDGNGNNYIGSVIEWKSSNAAVAIVSNDGLVTGIATGVAEITLTIDGISSTPFSIFVGDMQLMRSGIFVRSSYNATGTATLMKDDQGSLILKFSTDFSTQLLLGTYVYMSNSLNGAVIKSSGLSVKDISQSVKGAQSFDITALDKDATLDKYKYVIIFCQPAGITMAYAELK